MAMLTSVSDELTALADAAGPAVVRVEASHRRPGSGVVWAHDLVVTADHVVEDDEDIQIGFADGQTVGAALIGRDPTTDLAVLKLASPTTVPPPRWSDAAVRVGQLVLGLSRPGRTARAALGIISAAGGTWRTPAGGELDRYVQSDIRPTVGFSGGLLVDTSGNALGVNTAGLLRRTAITVPVVTLRNVVDMLRTHGRVRRGYLGIAAHPVRLPERFGQQLGQRRGLIVVGIEPGSPAEQGGLLVGDMITAIDDAPVRRLDEVAARLGIGSIGGRMALRLIRAGQLTDLSLTVGERR